MGLGRYLKKIDKPWDGLLEQVFVKSQINSFLLMKSNMICLVYIYDAILSGTNKQFIEDEIKILGVISNKHRHKFGLRYEGKVGSFIGINLENTG